MKYVDKIIAKIKQSFIEEKCIDVAHVIEQSSVTQKRQHLTKNNVKLNFVNRNTRTCQSHMTISFLQVVFKLPDLLE